MELKIGLNELNETVLEELRKIETPQFKFGVKRKKDGLMAGPEILQTFIVGLSVSAAWDMLKTLFSILKTYNIKMDPTNTDLGKIGSIYIGGYAANINITIQGDNSVLISDKENFRELIITENFDINEKDKR